MARKNAGLVFQLPVRFAAMTKTKIATALKTMAVPVKLS